MEECWWSSVKLTWHFCVIHESLSCSVSLSWVLSQLRIFQNSVTLSYHPEMDAKMSRNCGWENTVNPVSGNTKLTRQNISSKSCACSFWPHLVGFSSSLAFFGSPKTPTLGRFGLIICRLAIKEMKKVSTKLMAWLGQQNLAKTLSWVALLFQDSCGLKLKSIEHFTSPILRHSRSIILLLIGMATKSSL